MELKILAVTGPFLPNIGGMQFSTHQTLKGLSKYCKADITLIAPACEGDVTFDAKQSFRIMRFKKFGYLAAVQRMMFAFDLLKKGEYNALLLMGYETELAYGICSYFQKPSVDLFVLAAGTRLQLPNKNRFITVIRDFLICRSYRKSTFVIAISTVVKEIIENRTGYKKVARIPRPIDEEIWCKAEALKKVELPFKLVTVSRIYDQKNIQTVIKIVERLKKDGLNLHYYVVGDGEYLSTLKQLVTSLNLEQNVFFLGNLPPEKIVDLLKDMHVFILLSVANNGVGETFGRVYLESAAMRVPSIAYTSPGTRESVGDKAGWLLEPGNEEEGYQLLKQLYSDRSLLELKSKEAFNWYINNFTAEVVSKKIYDVLIVKTGKNYG